MQSMTPIVVDMISLALESDDKLAVHVGSRVVEGFLENETVAELRGSHGKAHVGCWLRMTPNPELGHFTVETLFEHECYGRDPRRIPTQLRFRQARDRLILQGVEVAAASRRTGIATDIALRIRALTAPTLPAYIQGSFSSDGRAWAEYMRAAHGWQLME